MPAILLLRSEWSVFEVTKSAGDVLILRVPILKLTLDTQKRAKTALALPCSCCCVLCVVWACLDSQPFRFFYCVLPCSPQLDLTALPNAVAGARGSWNPLIAIEILPGPPLDILSF